jgi:hypothetical protein
MSPATLDSSKMTEMFGVTPPVTQRRIGLRFRFEAGDDTLKYSSRDYSGERTIEIPYESMNLDQPAYLTLTATPLFRRLFGLVLLFFLLAAAFSVFVPDVAVLCAFATLPLSVAVIVGRLTGWSNIKLKLFQLQPYPPGAIGPMRIIDDAKGEQILALLRQARKAKFRRLYAHANLATDRNHEIARLTWLKNNDILSEDEWQVEIDKLNASAQAADPFGDGSDEEKRGAIH